jgi:23S rRNA (cytosine1962-C5)-methyltransferase
MTRGDEPFDDGLIQRRVQQAWEYRTGSEHNLHDACRLIFSESDGLPGLIVDMFNDQLVMQSLTVGIEKRLDQVVDALVGVMKPAGIYFKGKSPFRKLEGLPEVDRQLYGSTPEKVTFRDAGLIFTARPMEGQKTGYFLDQRGNRRLLQTCLESLLQGNDIIRLLDLYSYTGGWGLTALHAGVKEAVMIDSSARAIEWGMEDAASNGLSDRAVFIEADVEDFLREAAGRKKAWDVVVVDPPALIPNRQSVEAGIRAYTAINRAALRVVAPGGMLVTCSCSYHLSREKHLEIIGRAAFQEGRRIRIGASGGHAWDHPILPGHPETEYLKCWFLMTDGS